MNLSMLVKISLLCVATHWGMTVESSVSPSEVHIASPTTYEVKVTTPDSGIVELPGVMGNFGAFEAKSFEVLPEEIVDGKKVLVWKFKLSNFISGDFVIPPQLVVYRPLGSADSTGVIRTLTEPISIKVLSTLDQDMEDILDVEPVLEPVSEWLWLWLILGGLSGVVLLYFIFKKMNFAKKKVEVSPTEEALGRLKKLRKISNPESLEVDEQKKYFSELSLIVRTYLERELGVEALESTTKELLKRASLNSDFPEFLLKPLKQFQNKTDGVKFAKMSIRPEDIAELHQFVNEVISEAKKPKEVNS